MTITLEERIDYSTRDKLQETLNNMPSGDNILVSIDKNLLGLILELENMKIKSMEMENDIIRKISDEDLDANQAYISSSYSKDLDSIAEYKFNMGSVQERVASRLTSVIMESI